MKITVIASIAALLATTPLALAGPIKDSVRTNPAAVEPYLQLIKSEKRRRSPKPRRVTASSGRTCGGKRTCGEMDSCAEANFYLRQCGVSRLDGDGDGVPCEKICG